MDTMNKSPIDWFEIPVQDMDRAVAFYETLLAASMRRESLGACTLACSTTRKAAPSAA